jgi:predicted acylesterase/phospholipase RssA
MGDKSLDEMTEKFTGFATDTFSRPNAGDVLTKMKIGHMVTKIFMALGFTRTMFDSSPLKKGLIDFFGEETSLFSMARKRKHQCSTRVAVVASTDAGDTKCMIPSYNRPNLSRSPDFDREDDDDIGMKIWEAGLATSAAPFYLPPFKKLETGKEYVDGALYANCPAETALREMKHLWPHNRTSLDILLSLGTGQQTREIKIPKTVRIGGFEEICRSFHNNLDTEKLWERFLQTDAAESVKSRLRRLNPEIKPEIGYVSIFNYEKMTALQNMVDHQMRELRWHQEIQDISDTLMATLFYFEPNNNSLASTRTLSVDGTNSLKGCLTLPGTIRCRLRHNSVELKQLLSHILSFSYALFPENCQSHAVELPLNLHWIKIGDFDQIRTNIQDNKCRFRVAVSINGSRESPVPHVLAVRMKRKPEKWIPIT